MAKKPPALLAIIFYKGFVALLLTATSIVLLLALKRHDDLIAFAENYELEGKRQIIELLLEKIVNIKTSTLKFSGIAAVIYVGVTIVEVVGLWYEKVWAHILVIALVAISIPPEIFELTKGFSLIKLGVFIINIAVLGYLSYNFYKEHYQHSRQ
jgi:uncharacterized membrane protein (DUF2068 family)